VESWPQNLDAIANVWVADFEFRHPEGGLPEPRCLVIQNWRTREIFRWWLMEERPPCPFKPSDLLVAFYASAEMGCFLALEWKVRPRVLDLYVEFKNKLGGRPPSFGLGLLGACRHYGITTASSEDKDQNRLLAQQDRFTESERSQLLDYCQSDVEATKALLDKMAAEIDLPRALLRGRYMAAAASIERTGIPVDQQALRTIQSGWEKCRGSLIHSIDADFGVFEGITFKESLWIDYCNRSGIAWPRLPSGAADFKDETFRQMATLHPQIQPMRELRATLSQMKLSALAVGPDSRNRYMLSAFRSITGRNQPSNQKGIYGPATWIRHLIKPIKGRAICYIDYEQQEFGVAAALSGDKNMMDAYASGDPYLTFAKQAGAVPPEATKATHPEVRDLYKTTALGVQYGSGAESLAQRLGKTLEHAKALLRHHQRVYATFWRWSDAAATRGMLGRPLVSAFGWRTFGKGDGNPRTFRNFYAQANGAEMLRLAIIGLAESGISVCAPVHDAVLIEAPESEIDQVVAEARQIMEAASRVVLGGFTIRTEEKIVRYPERYTEKRGTEMWRRLVELLDLKE
jgi:hypothetical protein